VKIRWLHVPGNPQFRYLLPSDILGWQFPILFFLLQVPMIYVPLWRVFTCRYRAGALRL
jgi:hypothetical protein